MRPELELVIFDCDGVLVDSERIAVRVESALLGELGWPLTEAQVAERFLGRSAEFMFAEIETRLRDRLPDRWREQFGDRYRIAFETELAPVDGIVEALDAITTPVCVASSGTHEALRYTLGLTGLYERFAGHIFSTDDVARGKPAPDLFVYAAKRMGADPAACAVVEDSPVGVEAARAAGMQAFAYAGGLTPAEQLEGEATVVFERMADLPGLLADIRARR